MVCKALQMDMDVNRAKVGSKVSVTSRVMDILEAVSVKDALNIPKITFTPSRRCAMVPIRWS